MQPDRGNVLEARTEISISGSAPVTEGDYVTFTITAHPPPSDDLPVNIYIGQRGDFVKGALGSDTVTIPVAASSEGYVVSTSDDSIDEPNGSVTAEVRPGRDYIARGSSRATVAVNDDDVTPEISISGSVPVTEGADAAFTITAVPPPTASLDVRVNITQAGNFVPAGNLGVKTVTVPATGSASYSVSTSDDVIDESYGSVTAKVLAGTGYTVGTTSSRATVAVNDDDGTPQTTPEVNISGGSAVTEGADVTFTITAHPPPKAPLDVSLDITQAGNFVTSGGTGLKMVTVPLAGSVDYDVSTSDDGTDEPNGSVTATVHSGTGYTVGKSSRTTVAVNDDDFTPEVNISGGSAVTEGADVTFTITAHPPPKAPLDVSLDITQAGNFVTSGGTGLKMVTVPLAGSVDYDVSTSNDSTDEPNGSVTATVRSVTGYIVGSGSSATVTVNDDDDPPPTITISGGSEVTERCGEVTFTISADPAPSSPLDVSLDISQRGDFIASGEVGTKSVTVPGAGTSVTYTISPENDGTDEPDGYVTATVRSGTEYTVGTNRSATVTVMDNDDPVPSQSPVISVPSGFSISYYASRVPGARSLAMGSRGTLFVGTRTQGVVYALTDTDDNKHAEEVLAIAKGLDQPNGVAFRDGDLYVAETNRIIRYDDIEDNLCSPPEPVVITALPEQTFHDWRYIRFGPDGKLYAPIGSPCDICSIDETTNDISGAYASIMRMDPDGSNVEVFARGVRNSVGFDWHPRSGDLWFTDNGRDRIGDGIPPDELNRAPTSGLHFGFPYCYGADVRDPNHGSDEKPCSGGNSDFTHNPPAYNLPAHSVPLGMRFYTGSMFPSSYQNRIFIAVRGSALFTLPGGHRVATVTLNTDGSVASYEKFMDFTRLVVTEDGTEHVLRLGRPVDVLVAPDGALLVSDLHTSHPGRIHRISYP